MLPLKARPSVVTLKQLGLSYFVRFKQLPTFQKFLTIVTSITGVLFTRYIDCKLHRKFYNYPPGPIGLPVIGYSLSFNAYSRAFYKKITNYGDVNKGLTNYVLYI